MLIALSERGRLSLVKATPKGFDLVSQTQLGRPGSDVWSTPLIYKGRLYVKAGRNFTCFDISKK